MIGSGEAAGAPATKRVKILEEFDNELLNRPPGLAACLKLLATTTLKPMPKVPPSLATFGQTKNSLEMFRKLFDVHGFRTSVITSPRSAISIYKESCYVDDASNEGKDFLLAILGMHPDQADMEQWYATCIKNVYCLLAFCGKVRQICPKAVAVGAVNDLLEKNEHMCRNFKGKDTSPTAVASMDFLVTKAKQISATVPERLAELVSQIALVDPRIRTQQLEREYDRLVLWNSSFGNACLQLLCDIHACCIKDVYFKSSHLPKFERITVYLYDPNLDQVKPPRFTFLPSLRRALEDGPKAIAQDMIDSFWSEMLRYGYFATGYVKDNMRSDLEKYFLSGIAHDLNIPILLNAHFTPKYPLSFYLYGKAGSGKSSLVRNFSPAINAAIESHIDPEIVCRYVKQNLNKPQYDLDLELELRPNNNDLSVMSIIKGRRMSMTQSKPGIVIINLEELASNRADANPNQLKTAELISQRFSGRNSNYKEGTVAPRNSTKRGISGDASLSALFTSNYVLESPCLEALQRLEMFENLKSIEMRAVDGQDRRDFALCYLKQCVRDRFSSAFSVNLDIPLGSGDTRPLVRHLRMISFYVCAFANGDSSIKAKIVQKEDSHLCTVSVGEQSINLKVGTLGNLFPTVPRVFDYRTGRAIDELRRLSGASSDFLELSQIIDFYFAKTLAPAVVVSNNADLIKNLVTAVGAQENVHSITGVETGAYKIMKSLYDPNDTPNLRDDILKFGRGACVAVELKCLTMDGQLCIREIIEDSPSMTAFSTNKSALYKSGLLFAVYVAGELTPEVKSRASILI